MTSQASIAVTRYGRRSDRRELGKVPFGGDATGPIVRCNSSAVNVDLLHNMP